MAKSGKPTPKHQAPKPITAAITAPKILQDHLARPATDPPSTPDWLPKAFWGLAIVSLLLYVGLSFGSGINADDKFQVDYSQKLVSYYATFGKDTSALLVPDGNMHLYGGFFEVVTGFVNKVAGNVPNDLAYHHVRHASSAILGWVALLCAALLARLIAGWQAGFIALLILTLSPRFLGDSMMNPKDIPFAAGYMMALYNLAAVLNRMPKPGRWNLIGLALGLGIGLAMRAGGLLTFVYAFMFTGLHFYLKNGGFAAFTNNKLLGRYALVLLGTSVVGYVIALLFWPYALQSPLQNPLTALSKFSVLEVKIRVLFEGSNVMSNTTPWYYPVKWIAYTIPLAALAGFVGSVVLLPRLLKRYNPLWVFMVLFTAVFPVAYIIYKDSVIHDGWRHLTFVYPSLVVAAALFWNELVQYFSEKKALQYATYGVLGLGLLDPAAFIATNPKFPYVYFNPISGGIKGAYGEFETDYWGVSVRQGIEWMEQQGILKSDMTETVVIATNMFYSTARLTAKYGDKVKVKYLKWEKRCDDAWDYGLYPTRFLSGATLDKGMWPPDNAVHMVEASGVPLLAVLKDNGRNCSLGIAYLKVGDFEGAIVKLKAELENVPDNELAWGSLAQAYLNSGQLDEGKAAAEKCLEICPDDAQALNTIGLYWINKEDIPKAKDQFATNVKRDPSNATAWYYLGLLSQAESDNVTALNYLMKAIQASPGFKPAYETSAQIYDQMGETARARQFRDAIAKIK